MLTGFESSSLTASEIVTDPVDTQGWDLARPKSPGGISWTVKTIVERAIAFASLTGLAPLLAIISLLIIVESGRPVLFRQPRFGLNGIPFNVLKFRTMWTELCDSTGAGQTSDADPRVTRVGLFLRRTSLDELPQLWNVLVGQMALVGPRAHPCGMQVEGRLCEDLLPNYQDRHKVPPGITGWAQVNGSRGAVKTDEMLHRRVSLDLEYIENWSLWLDLKILWRTVWVVLSGKLAR
jgi:lipopolysaccharide/colanic/teichoic acid biosynthesis glycosyltransferase